jgi:hypothetical protein
MWPMPIVAMEPVEQLGRSLIRVLIGASVSPFAKRGLNEALSFSIGLRSVWPSEDLAKAEASLNGSTNHCPSSRVAAQNTTDGGRWDPDLNSDLLACPALPTQSLDLLNNSLGRRPVQPMRPGWAILQSRQSFPTISINPLANRPRADACGFGDGLRRLPVLNLPYNPLSTARRQPGILMYVHPVLHWNLKLQQPQLPRSEPDEQPNESSQLATLRQRARPQ